ncbi:unnamed protein product [Schistocephalus solidus]|uniref:Histone H1 n=1 Tax=Schistocephalus solidus TaxID=70667 RepID=A0A183TQ18_SCHSO|nr:unnamed protein product [Schistocephalus solidus]
MEMSPWVLVDKGVKYDTTRTLKTFLKQLQIKPATWEDLARNRRGFRRTVRTGAAIYEANRIDAAKTNRVVRKSPAPRTNMANAQTLQHAHAVNAPSPAAARKITVVKLKQATIPPVPISRAILSRLLG